MKALIHSILFIRQLLFFVYAMFVVVGFGTISPLLVFLRVPLAIRIRMPHFWAVIWKIGIFCILWVRFEVKGKENIPKHPCIYICKHQSQLETFFLNYILPRAVYVFKKELLSVPFLGWGLKATGSIPIDRTQGVKSLKDVVKQGKQRLKDGISIIIFPEGTRSKPGEHPKFHKSGLMLANSSNGDVVLVAHNSGSVMLPDSKLVLPKKITVVIHKPINAKDFTLDELNEYSYNWIKEQMQQLEK